MNSPKIGIGLPTRGIIDTLTIESVLREAVNTEVDYELFFTNDKPLPDSRIDITERFLASDCDYIWWVDDDVVIPEGFLQKMIDLATEDTMATGSYFMQNGQQSAHFEGDDVTQCGFGCVLIHRNVYLGTPQPWYKTNLVKIISGGVTSWVVDKKRAWGGEDIWFYHQAIDNAGFHIKLAGLVGHLRIRDWGDKYLNNGVHDIYFLTEEGQEGFALPKGVDWHYEENKWLKEHIDRMKNV